MSNDTNLIPYKGIGNSSETSYIERDGYSFVGNQSKKHLDLIFREDADTYRDIYYCSNFKTLKELELKDRVTIRIYQDEKADFNPKMFDYLAKNKKCINAIEEFSDFKETIIEKSALSNWLKKHDTLFKSFNWIPENYKYFQLFNTLYFTFKHLIKISEYEQLAEIACKEYEQPKPSNENNLLEWYSKYEELFQNTALIYNHELKIEEIDFINFFNYSDYKICFYDFKNIFKFSLYHHVTYLNLPKNENGEVECRNV